MMPFSLSLIVMANMPVRMSVTARVLLANVGLLFFIFSLLTPT